MAARVGGRPDGGTVGATTGDDGGTEANRAAKTARRKDTTAATPFTMSKGEADDRGEHRKRHTDGDRAGLRRQWGTGADRVKLENKANSIDW